MKCFALTSRKLEEDNLGPLCEAAMSAAVPAHPRSPWLNSPDALLQVLCCVAFCGHDARNFSSLTRAFRGDEVLWGCIKDRRGPIGRTALMASCRSGDLARVRWLLERSADVNAITSGATFPSLSLLRLDSWSKNGQTPLMLACSHGHLEIVRELLMHGACVNVSHIGGQTLLMEACKTGHLEIVRALLKQGANVNAARTDGCWTSLLLACDRGHLEIVRELLQQGADVKAVTAFKQTSLMVACMGGHIDIARLLLAHHASKATRDASYGTAYDYTLESNTELRALVKP